VVLLPTPHVGGDLVVRHHGRAVQVDPVKPTVKAPGIKLLKLKYGKLLSNLAVTFNFHHYTAGRSAASPPTPRAPRRHRGDPPPRCRCRRRFGRAPTWPSSRQGLTLVHFSAQPKPCLTQTHTLHTPTRPLTPPKQPLNAPPEPW